MRFSSKYQSGLTIIEIVVGLAIGSLLIAALLRFLVVGYPISRITLLQVNSNETARLRLERIGREIRQARLADNGAYPLVEMLPQRLIFFADIDDDPEIERLRYELSGTELQRGVINPSGDPVVYASEDEVVTVVARNIQNGSDAIFSYFNGDYPDDLTPLTPVDVTEVKYIEFSLLIDADPDSDPAPVEVISQVQLRNLKTNLGEISEP